MERKLTYLGFYNIKKELEFPNEKQLMFFFLIFFSSKEVARTNFLFRKDYSGYCMELGLVTFFHYEK
jgi:hypothetical protein